MHFMILMSFLFIFGREVTAAVAEGRSKGTKGREQGKRKGKRGELDLATRNALENADILSSCQHDNKN